MSCKSISYLKERERFLIEEKLKSGKSIYQIAEEIKRNPSTIYRELNRNGFNKNNYDSQKAQKKSQKTKKAKNKKLKENRYLFQNEKLFKEIIKHLKDKVSPFVIAKYFLKNQVSYNTIYNHIYYLASLGREEYKLFYNQHKKRKKQKKGIKNLISNRVSIHERPWEIELKNRFGDFELDLIQLKKGYLISVVDRMTKKGFLEIIPCKKAELVSQKVVKILSKYKGHIKTITTDNGLEFSKHQEIAKVLDCQIYFCDPYCSSQKGIVENFNKMVRKYLSRNISYKQLTKLKLKQVIDNINNYPRAILNFKSANEFFNKYFVATTP